MNNNHVKIKIIKGGGIVVVQRSIALERKCNLGL